MLNQKGRLDVNMLSWPNFPTMQCPSSSLHPVGNHFERNSMIRSTWYLYVYSYINVTFKDAYVLLSLHCRFTFYNQRKLPGTIKLTLKKASNYFHNILQRNRCMIKNCHGSLELEWSAWLYVTSAKLFVFEK